MMKNLGKFTLYTPSEPIMANANHLKNTDDTDWYTISWDNERTAKNIYAGTDDSGRIVTVTDNGAMLFPVNMTVWEVPKDEAPENILTDGYNATIIDGKYAIDYVSMAEKKRQSLISTANNTISDWRTELQLETITDDDKAGLIKWMTYIKALKSLDTSKAPNVTWPEKPEN